MSEIVLEILEEYSKRKSNWIAESIRFRLKVRLLFMLINIYLFFTFYMYQKNSILFGLKFPLLIKLII